MDTLTPSSSVTDTQAVPGTEAAEQPVKKFENVAQIVSSISRPKVVTFSHLVRKLKEYLPPADIEKVLDAFRFADEMHLGLQNDTVGHQQVAPLFLELGDPERKSSAHILLRFLLLSVSHL